MSLLEQALQEKEREAAQSSELLMHVRGRLNAALEQQTLCDLILARGPMNDQDDDDGDDNDNGGDQGSDGDADDDDDGFDVSSSSSHLLSHIGRLRRRLHALRQRLASSEHSQAALRLDMERQGVALRWWQQLQERLERAVPDVQSLVQHAMSRERAEMETQNAKV
jgi:hypothetical protein